MEEQGWILKTRIDVGCDQRSGSGIELESTRVVEKHNYFMESKLKKYLQSVNLVELCKNDLKSDMYFVATGITGDYFISKLEAVKEFSHGAVKKNLWWEDHNQLLSEVVSPTPIVQLSLWTNIKMEVDPFVGVSKGEGRVKKDGLLYGCRYSILKISLDLEYSSQLN